MMTKKEYEVLIGGLKALSSGAAGVAHALETLEKGEVLPEEVGGRTAAPEPEAEKVWTMEEVRAILAEKSRGGHRAEVKELLTNHGAAKLSEITDPGVLAAIAKEAEGIGNA